MISSTPYTTRVQRAILPEMAPELLKLLRKQPSFELVRPSIGSGRELTAAVAAGRPDVLVLDMTLPGLAAEEVLADLGSSRICPISSAAFFMASPFFLE